MMFPTGPQPKARILVVDDEDSIRVTLSALLQRQGYRVSLAANGEQALTYLAHHPTDLVLLDLIMPGMSGLDVATCVRALRPATLILLFTGSEQLVELAHSKFASIEKTAAPQEVLDLIAALLAAGPPLPAARAAGAALPAWHTALVEGFTHDMRNMLSIIQGSARLIARHTASVPTAVRAIIADRLEAINTAAHQIDAQIAQLGRDTAGVPAAHTTDLVALARHIAAAHQPPGAPHPIQVRSDAAQLLGTWDNVGLARVLDNLVGNAVKYSPAGRPISIWITTEVDAAGTWAIVRVCDQGIGIPAGDLGRIFSPYYRAANVPPGSEGHGLGLASVRQLVAAAGGAIDVQSQEGAGSCFTIRLPLHPAAALLEMEAVYVRQ